MLWTTDHVMNTERRLTKLTSDAYMLAASNVWWQKFMCERPGEGAKQDFEWLLTNADIHRLNSAADGLRFDDLITQAHSVTHEDFGTGLRITFNQFDDDAFTFAGDWATQIGSRMALDPQYELIRMMQAGETALAYDAKAFYATDHPVNPYNSARGTYANLITDVNDMDGSIANATAPLLTVANLAIADAYIRSMVMPNGKNRNLQPAILRTGPLLKKEALEITSAGFIGATENVMAKYAIEPVVVNELTGRDWYLDCTIGETPGLLPFVRFNRRAYSLTSYTGMTQAELSRKNELEWHLRGRFGHMYGHPYQSFKFKVS